MLIFESETWVPLAEILKTRERACGFPKAGDGEEGKKTNVQFFEEGGSGQRATGGGYTTTPDLH